MKQFKFLLALFSFNLLSLSGAVTDPAAVALNVNRQNHVTFFIFGTGQTGKLSDLPQALKKSGYTQVDISAWSSKIDYAQLLQALRDAQLTVTRCYVPQRGKAAWYRQDLAHCATAPTPIAPLTYQKKFIQDHAYNRRYKLPGKFEKIRYVTIHNTAEPFSALQERDRVDFRRDRQSVSFHYAVDEKMIVQLIPLKIHAWHAGDGHGPGNCQSIGIEICRSQCRDGQNFLYQRSELHAQILAAALLRHFKLPVANLRMHHHWSGKFCPHRIMENHSWPKFCQAVKQRLAAPPASEEQRILEALRTE